MMTAGIVQAQDIHFSQYNASPLALNPALTGVNGCDWRAGLAYRNQWASVTTPYVTYEAFFDMPLIKDIGGASQLSAGLLLFNDVSGDGNLTNLQAMGSVAFNLGLGGSQDNVLSLGLQGGLMNKSLDWAELNWGTMWDGDEFDPTIDPGEPLGEGSLSKFDLNAGLAFAGKFSENFNLTVGAAAFHLIAPQESFLNDTENKLGMRMAGHLRAGITVGKNFGIMPSVLYQTQSKATEIVVGSDFGYYINNASFPATIFLGVHDRLDDAIIASIGIDYKNFRFGASYDINNSSLEVASNGKGGMEFTLVYTGCILPVIPKNYVMPCPRY
jgi:type IX secretion system PorP/SprF family membrane protein